MRGERFTWAVGVVTGLLLLSAPSAAVAWHCDCERFSDESLVHKSDADVVATVTIGSTWDDIWVEEVESGKITPNKWHEVKFRSCGEVRPELDLLGAARIALKERDGALTYTRCTSERLSKETLPGFATRLRGMMKRPEPKLAPTGFAGEESFTGELRRMCQKDGYHSTIESLGPDSLFLRPLADDASRDDARGYGERQKVLMACALEANEWAAAAEHEAAAGDLRIELHEAILRWAASSERAHPWGTAESRFGAELDRSERRALLDEDLLSVTRRVDHPLLFEGIADFFDHPDATLAERLTAAMALERAALRATPEAAAIYEERARQIDTAGLFDEALTAQNLNYDQWEFRFMQKAENEAAFTAHRLAGRVKKQIALYQQEANFDEIDRLTRRSLYVKRFLPVGTGVALLLVLGIAFLVLKRFRQG